MPTQTMPFESVSTPRGYPAPAGGMYCSNVSVAGSYRMIDPRGSAPSWPVHTLPSLSLGMIP